MIDTDKYMAIIVDRGVEMDVYVQTEGGVERRTSADRGQTWNEPVQIIAIPVKSFQVWRSKIHTTITAEL